MAERQDRNGDSLSVKAKLKTLLKAREIYWGQLCELQSALLEGAIVW
jgi:hypothetical protein